MGDTAGGPAYAMEHVGHLWDFFDWIGCFWPLTACHGYETCWSGRMQTGGQVECNFATPPDWLLSCTLLTDSVENSLPWFVLQKSARLRLKSSLLAAVSQAQISRSSLQK